MEGGDAFLVRRVIAFLLLFLREEREWLWLLEFRRWVVDGGSSSMSLRM